MWFRAQAEIGTESIRRLWDPLLTGILPNLSVAEFALHPVLWPSSHKDHAFILDSRVISMTRKVQTQGSTRAGCYRNGELPQSSLRGLPSKVCLLWVVLQGLQQAVSFLFFFLSPVFIVITFGRVSLVGTYLAAAGLGVLRLVLEIC